MSDRFFVTGTDTGVGKTQVSCALLRLLAKRGDRPFAYKPAESGGTGDAEALRAAAGGWQSLEQVCRYQLKAPLAPAIAAREEGGTIRWNDVLRGFRDFGRGAGVVEGAGGLFVPFTSTRDVIDLIAATKLPVVLVARAGLGTINHVTLSLEALERRALKIAAVVLSQGVREGDPSIPFNRAELERRFPKLRFIGPVGFHANAKQRSLAFDEALAPLIARW